MRWIELFLTVVREGLGDPISLEFLLPHTGQERLDILAEVDAVALYHYKLKVAYEDKLRRRFGKVQGQSDADAEDEATQALVQGVVGEISFGELVAGDAVDIAAEETDESDGSSSEYETESDSDDDDTDESSEEHIAAPPPPSKPVVSRLQTESPVIRHSSPRPHGNQMNDAARPRPRSLSLRSAKSMTFSPISRSAKNPGVPPVPVLPKGLPMSPLSKPLPPSPMPLKHRQHSSTDNLSSAARRQAAAPLTSRKGKSKKAQEVLKSPELRHIPQLLPVFTEMVSQTLYSRIRRRALIFSPDAAASSS